MRIDKRQKSKRIFREIEQVNDTKTFSLSYVESMKVNNFTNYYMNNVIKMK